MSAMFVVDMAMIVMLGMLVSGHMVARDGCVGVVVMMMSVIVVTVRVMSMMVMKRRRVRQDRRKLWLGSAVG
jgi:uncharacterized membrane protein YcaP (DUF421 family)